MCCARRFTAVGRGAEEQRQSSDVLFGRVREAWGGNGPWAATNAEGELIAVFELWKDRIAKPTVVFGGRG